MKFCFIRTFRKIYIYKELTLNKKPYRFILLCNLDAFSHKLSLSFEHLYFHTFSSTTVNLFSSHSLSYSFFFSDSHFAFSFFSLSHLLSLSFSLILFLPPSHPLSLLFTLPPSLNHLLLRSLDHVSLFTYPSPCSVSPLLPLSFTK